MSRRTREEMLSALEKWAIEAGQPSLVLALLTAHSAMAKLLGAPTGGATPARDKKG